MLDEFLRFDLKGAQGRTLGRASAAPCYPLSLFEILCIDGLYNAYMPPSPIPNENADRLLPPGDERTKGSAGAVVGIIIIVILMLFGALYFWGARLNAQSKQDQLPFIPADNSTGSAQ